MFRTRLLAIVVPLLVLSLIAPAPLSAQAQPQLTVSPPSGQLGSTFTVLATGFPPNTRIRLVEYGPDGQAIGQPGFLQTDDSGNTRVMLAPAAAGTYTVVFGYGQNYEEFSVRTTFVVLRPDQCFPQTQHCLSGLFLDYWTTHGGLAVNGYPLTEPVTQKLEDGRYYIVQYFERVRLEYHPENQPPYDVELGQFGRRILADVPNAPTAPAARKDGYTFFEQTGHNVRPEFIAYWQANGGLAQFGYPLSEEFTQTLEDGKSYTVQYFERARFELHPENAGTPYEVLLGQFGRRIVAAIPPGDLTPALPPPSRR